MNQFVKNTEEDMELRAAHELIKEQSAVARPPLILIKKHL
ncbi:hypothetical protein FERRO_06140 [Ferrovum sp. JA12]|nr:hypothetical protein FERRO_06140 [Ferrovum sp. JA12]